MRFDPASGTAVVAPLRLVLLANVRLYREGLASALATVSGVKLIAAAPAEPACLPMIAEVAPDVVLLDASAGRAPQFVQSILSAAPMARVVAFAIDEEDVDALHCAEAGAAGYVSREATVEELVAAVLGATRGEFSCSPRFAALLARRVSALASRISGSERDRVIPLTAREREVLRLVDEGLSNKEIAGRLGISIATVKNHVHHLLEKTHSSRRAHAAARLRNSLRSLSVPKAPVTPL